MNSNLTRVINQLSDDIKLTPEAKQRAFTLVRLYGVDKLHTRKIIAQATDRLIKGGKKNIEELTEDEKEMYDDWQKDSIQVALAARILYNGKKSDRSSAEKRMKQASPWLRR